jgi:hypothetical protein
MLNTYIKNVGSTQTLIGNNCGNHVEKLDWDADYDGNRANVLVKSDSDGKKKMFHFTLDNGDLANMLNINSVNMPIDKRLKMDFKKPRVFRNNPKMIKFDVPTPELMPRAPSYLSDSSSYLSDSSSYSPLLLESGTPDSFLSSPASNEEFIIPVTLDQRPYDRFTFTPKRRNLTLKTHKTHRVFKRARTTPRRSSRSSRRRSRSSRR